MAPLDSLEPNYPLIDSDFRRFCASQGIFSGFVLIPSSLSLGWIQCFVNYPFLTYFVSLLVEIIWFFILKFSILSLLLTVDDFLIHDLYMLAALAEQYPSSDRLKEVRQYSDNLIFTYEFFLVCNVTYLLFKSRESPKFSLLLTASISHGKMLWICSKILTSVNSFSLLDVKGTFNDLEKSCICHG